MVSVHCSTLACTKFNEQNYIPIYLDNIIPCVHASCVSPTWVLPLVWPALKLCCMLDIFPWVIWKLDFLIWDSNVSVLRLYTHCSCTQCIFIVTGEWGRGGGNSLRAGFPAFEVEYEGLSGLLGQLIHMILYEERNTDLHTSDGYLPSIFHILNLSPRG